MKQITVCHSLFAIILLLIPVPVFAIPAITCHCFTDRSYDPARPALADPYFLATTQNSFFAAIFAIDKKSIVMKKQKGASSDDLWVAYGISARSGVSPDILLQAKQTKETWHDVVRTLNLSPQSWGKALAAAFREKASTPRLAEAVVNDAILRYRLLDDGELAALRKAGASNQELCIVTLLAAKSRQPARQVLATVKSGAKSWGKALAEARVDPSAIQQEVSALVRPPR